MSVALPKTPVGKDYDKTIEMIEKIAEPSIAKIIDKLNSEILAKYNVRVGASIEWYIERTE